jgi:hypothetical protein
MSFGKSGAARQVRRRQASPAPRDKSGAAGMDCGRQLQFLDGGGAGSQKIAFRECATADSFSKYFAPAKLVQA